MASFQPKPFGKYFLVDRLAIGGMAEIYKAKTFGVDGFEKLIAIKKILPHYSADKEFIAMLTDEAKLVVRLSHTNIVQIYDLGKVGDDYYISMEFIDGVNLREVINRGKELKEKIPLPICLYITSEICKGLDYAHSKRDHRGQPLGIVHRDVSPQNILISFEGETKIVDFGIAKAAMNVSQTTAGTLKGKITYMSPEQALGKPVDARTDLFSAGILLFEMISGERLYTGDTQFEVLKKIRTTQITREFLSGKVPPEAEDLLLKALAYQPKDRFETAGDFQIALTKMLYSRYSDFSPKQLSQLIQSWFSAELKLKHRRAEEEDSISTHTRNVLQEAGRQKSIVHRTDDTGSSKLSQQTTKTDDMLGAHHFVDTVGPEENVKPDQFKAPEAKKPEERKPEPAAPARPLSKPLIYGLAALLAAAVGLGIFAALRKDAPPPPAPEETIEEPEAAEEPPEEAPIQRGIISIESVPSEAEVLLDGVGLGKKTPVDLDQLEIGKTYRLELKREGYRPYQQEISVKSAEAVLVDAKLEPIPYASLRLESDPPGAAIFLDGKSTGKSTPATLEQLVTPKVYEVSLRKPRYKELTLPIELKETGGFEQRAALELLDQYRFGKINIRSIPPDAAVAVDGQPLENKSPYLLEKAEIGKTYEVRLSKEGFLPFTKQVTVTDTGTLNLDAKLEKIPPPRLKITSNVPGASITVNGVKKGKTPATVQLSAGEARVQLSKPGYSPAERTVTLNDGENRELALSLEAIARPEPPKPAEQAKPEEPKTAQPPPPKTDKPVPSAGGMGSIRMDSSPRGASVVIDGEKAGITPVVIPNLDKGKPHTVTVTLPGHKSWTKTFTLSQNHAEFMAQLQRE